MHISKEERGIIEKEKKEKGEKKGYNYSPLFSLLSTFSFSFPLQLLPPPALNYPDI